MSIEFTPKIYTPQTTQADQIVFAPQVKTTAPAKTEAKIDCVDISGVSAENSQVSFFAPTAPKKTEAPSAADTITAATQGVDIGREAAKGIATAILAAIR